jgi:hypothetical protein
VLPCVDVFVADEFCVWASILRTRLALRLGAQLADVPCVALGWADAQVTNAVLRWGPNLRTCLAFCWGAHCGRALRTCVGFGTQLADVPCIVLGHPTLVRRIKKSTSKPKFVLIHPLARLLA